ncbi:MAG TPA: hypothetical protein VMW89_16805 [Desulfatiglandales bacterium]|nr:hypothetical protein [Desulfatiglandales bacterium]
MPRPRPHEITVKFDDGSMAIAPFESLPDSLRYEIERQPFACKPSPNPEKEKFLLLEWDDGWREVIQVDAACTEINRYYVISRIEHVGRLSIKKQNGYPDLIDVVRRPLNVKRITFMDTFELALERSDREGHKTDHFFCLAKKGKGFSEIIRVFKEVVRKEGIDLKEFNSKEPSEISKQCEKIRRKMGLKAGLRQQDVFDFIAYLVKLVA